jgi:putative ATPase
MKEPSWYEPVDRGLESKIAERMRFLKDLDTKAKGS